MIKIITGILRESKGEILIDGKRPGVYTKSIVSYLPDRNFLYNWMNIYKKLLIFIKTFIMILMKIKLMNY